MTDNISPTLTLTDEFKNALKHLETGSHLFLTGKAGTGKSTLIRFFSETNDKNLVVAAPTGVAALNVAGYTLHRLFSFPAGVSPEFVRSDQYFPRRFFKTLKSLDTLIVDEASMIRSDLLDSISIALRRFGPKPSRPFGGVQIVLVGDLYQLPPVVLDAEHEYFSTVYSSPYFFSAEAYEQVEFPTVELTTIFRQDGDPQLVGMLNSIRDGQATPKVVESLNDSVDASFEPGTDEFWLTLTTTNRIADARNKAKLDTLASALFTSQAKTTGVLDNFDTPTQDNLAFKVGAQIMLLTNDQANRWVNGSLAVITHVAEVDDAYHLEIELRNGDRHTIESHTWEITRPITNGGKLSHEVIGTFRQLPFRLAWAVTVHKAQGLTLERCIVDFSGGAFADGQLYVALSRARSLDGLVLARPIRPRDLRVNQHIRRFHHTHAGGDHGEPVVLAANFVGDDGFQWRPRPIELAIILPDGTELSTLVDPQRDIGDAATAQSISAEDVVLAPTLPQAWSAMAPYLAGRIPVGVGMAETLEYIDYELKRHEHIIQIPIGVDIQSLGSNHTLHQLDQTLPAMEQARFIKTALDNLDAELPAATAFNGVLDRFGYLLPRSSTQAVQFVVASQNTQSLTQYLETLAQEARNSTRLLSTLQAVEKTTGHKIFDDDFDSERNSIAEVIQVGFTLCFTGEARDPITGAYIARAELEEMAATKSLKTEPNLTKSRTDVLIVAEFGTQSGKAKKARQWGKPIFSVEEFLNWVNGNTVSSPSATYEATNVILNDFPTLNASRPPDAAPDKSKSQKVNVFEGSSPGDNATQRSLSRKDARTYGLETPNADEIPWSSEAIEEFLTTGAEVAITGTVYHPDNNRRVVQTELAEILAEHGFEYVRNLTQQSTTLLLVGEIQNVTRQITTAIDYGKPIFRSADFFAWLALTGTPGRVPTDSKTQTVNTFESASVAAAPDGMYPSNTESVQTVDGAIAGHRQPSLRSQNARPAYPRPEQELSLPIWVRLSNQKFYAMTAALPLGLIVIVPTLLMLVGVMTGIAATVMLCGMLSVPVALVFVGLRVSGRRRWRRATAPNQQTDT